MEPVVSWAGNERRGYEFSYKGERIARVWRALPPRARTPSQLPGHFPGRNFDTQRPKTANWWWEITINGKRSLAKNSVPSSKAARDHATLKILNLFRRGDLQ